ncbi:Hypothetical protein FKW44_004716 [Caligus rogercresseyi]|uniref:Uncharacterized protein n=1 Tax=Caligus rogercresseyi TaxID=217165 RepID=A0A7T8HMB5_CALRO|nr:Hypothetical protein FKW44_004716 [Caligus rogercresseyi]
MNEFYIDKVKKTPGRPSSLTAPFVGVAQVVGAVLLLICGGWKDCKGHQREEGN